MMCKKVFNFHNFSCRSKDAGFTLIELLVVISVISILSSITIANLSSIRAKARDSVRISDLRNIEKALILFKEQFGEYPTLNNGVDMFLIMTVPALFH